MTSTPLPVLAAHLAVALERHRRALRDDAMVMPPELDALADLALALGRSGTAPSGQERPKLARVSEPAHPAHERELLTTREAADVLGVSERTVRRLVATGAIGSVLVGRSRRIPRADIDTITESRSA